MSELPITSPAVIPSVQTPGRNNASRPNADEATETGIPAGTPASFAATLKSLAEKKSATSAKEEPFADSATPVAEPATLTLIPPAAPEVSESSEGSEASATPIDSSALLSLLQADTALAQALVAPAITPASIMASVPKPAMSPASAVSPAPTFPLSQGSTPKNTLDALPSVLATDSAGESHPLIPKFAAPAASSAESSQEIPAHAAANQAQETFSTVMDRITNHSAAGFAHSPTNGTSATSALSPALELPVEIRLGQTAWRDEVGQKLTWMVSNNRQQADLVLNPPQLGRIEVTLSLDGNQASASFTSPHAAVREALEGSMTRLREVLAEAGVTLGQAHVGSESRRDSNPMHSKNEGLVVMRQENGRYVAALDSSGGGLTSRGTRAHSLVDIFA